MAIALVSNNRGVITTGTGGFDEAIDLPAGASVAVGNTLILTAAYDNSGTSGVDPGMFVASSSAVTALPYYDLRGNRWDRLAKAVRDPGAANEGAVVDIWACYVQFPYEDGDDITVQWAFSVAFAVLRIAEFSGIKPLSYSVVEPISGTGSSTTIGPTGTITPGAVGQMVIGVAAIETNTAITGDADTTDGSWASITNNTANSGTDATSVACFAQYKVVTGTSAQDWDCTKTGASDFAAVAVVFDVFVDDPADFVPGNPDYPCIAGPEILPTSTVFLPLDTGTEYLFTHKVFPNDYGSQDYRPLSVFGAFAGQSGTTIQAHTYAFDVYLEGDELPRDPVEILGGTVTAAGLGGGASVSGAQTAADALEKAGGDHVILESENEYVEVLFDVSSLTSLYPNHRILRWGVRYLAWKDDSSPPTPGEGLGFQWRDSAGDNGNGSNAMLGYWLVQNYQRNAQYETRWFGEVNSVPRGKGAIVFSELHWGASFTVNDLSHMDTLDQTTRIRITGGTGEDPLQTNVYLDTIQMIVELVPERRQAVGMRRVINSPAILANTYPSGLARVPVYTALDSNTRWVIPAADNTYVLAAREALPASPSDYYAVRTSGARTISANEALGSPYVIPALQIDRQTLDPQPTVRKGLLSKGRLAEEPVVVETLYPSITALNDLQYALDGTYWPSYQADSPGNAPHVYDTDPKTQYVIVDGVATFDRIKLLLQPDELTVDALDISVEQPLSTPLATATVTVAQALARPDLGLGWREISVPLDTAITPGAGQVAIVMSSNTTSAMPWYVALGFPMTTWSGYNLANSDLDYAVVLECELDDPAVALDTVATPLFRPTDRCVLATVNVPEITISNGGSYDWISIERSVNAGSSWAPVALLDQTSDDESPLADTVYVDYAAPWDLPAGTITYRVRGYRDADHLAVTTITAGWGGTATAPGAAFGIATDSALFAYIPVSEGTLEIQWNPLNPMSMVPLHGVDYQVALRSPEERGLSVSVTIVTDKIVTCDGPVEEFLPEIVERGPQSMTPTPYDQLRALEGEAAVLLLPGGHSRFVVLDVGDMTVTVERGIYLAEITLTDATIPDVAPYDAVNL